MKINKNQALYRALPHCWTTYSDSKKSDNKYACEVTVWNTTPVKGVNENIIKDAIKRRVASFEQAGGKVDNELSNSSIDNFKFVEAAMKEGITDIGCRINPTTFYCQKCENVLYKPKLTSAPLCPECMKNNKKQYMTQLQMVYVCDCGYADGVKPISRNPLKYHAKDKDNQFKFYSQTGSKIEMKMQCPVCNKYIYPKNALDTSLFYSQNGSVVNLYNTDYAKVLDKYKTDAEILMLAKWFGLIDNQKFLNILDDSKNFFEYKSKDVNDPMVIHFARSLNKTPEEVVALFNEGETTKDSIYKLKNDIRNIVLLDSFGDNQLKIITSCLTEFDTLKNPKGKITLEEGIKKNIDIGSTVDETDIYLLLNKIHIKDMQISEQVEIVNYAYGYTRLRSCPDGTPATANLRLRGFKNDVFTSILKTEGILVEIDMLSVLKWLVNNNIIKDDIIIDSYEDAKKWFIENIDLSAISHYATISATDNLVTKAVYSLLHTISHMMIISAGKHSGLSRDSISEIIFANTCSFFIYPTTTEGVTLGSISGMFETDLRLFLEDALKDNEICTFDPVCMNNQNGACMACAYLSEVNCTHFNKDLSRAYLYSGKINKNNENITIKKGFWK